MRLLEILLFCLGLFRFRAKVVRSPRIYPSLTLVLLILGGGRAWSQSAPQPSAVQLTVTSGGNQVASVASPAMVTLTATVTNVVVTQQGVTPPPPVPVAPGTVLFCDATAARCQDSAVLGTAQLTASGIATFRFYPGIGAHSYKAVFAGTTAYATSSSVTENLTVTGTKGSVTLLPLPNTPATGAGNYNLTAMVGGVGLSGTPTGSVTFKDTTKNLNLTTTSLTGIPTVNVNLIPGATPPSLQYDATRPVVADFNGDGKLDFAATSGETFTVSCGTSSQLNVQLGNGDGTFNTGAIPVTNGNPILLNVGDVNNDGKPDLIAGGMCVTNDTVGSTQVGLPQLTILLGNGNGTFTTGSSPSIGTESDSEVTTPSAIAVGDFNNDGNLDLAIATYTYVPNGSGQITSNLQIQLGHGDGTFTQAFSTSTSASYGLGLALGDMNGDGKLDLALYKESSGAGNNEVDILTGNGDGTLTSGQSITLGGSNEASGGLLLADFNGDGKLDFATSWETQGSDGDILHVGIFTGNGDGTFSAGNSYVVNSDDAYENDIALGDFNADGKPDIAVVDCETNLILLNNGDGTFTPTDGVTGATSFPNEDTVAVGDFNGDGVPDLVNADGDNLFFSIFLTQRASVVSTASTPVHVIGNTADNIIASYSGDTSFSPSASDPLLLPGGGTVATSLTLASSATTAVQSQQVVLTARQSPYSYAGATTNGESITFYVNGNVLGTAPLSSGVATLNTTSLPVGSDAITASYSGDSTFSAFTTPLTLAVPISITAPAAPAPAVSLSPASLSFPSQTMGTTSAAQIVTLTNTGNAPLTVSSITASGDFAQTNSCGSSVAAGANCMISVTFTPTVGGTRTGTVTITDNASGSPQTVSLTGAGATVTITPGASSLTIGSPGGTATTTLQFASVNGFSGTMTLSCAVNFQGQGTPSSPPTCSLNPSSVNVAGDGSPRSTTLTVSSTAASASAVDSSPLPRSGVVVAAFLVAGFLLPRRRWRGALLALVCLVAIGGMIGCGGSSSPSSTSTTTTTTPTTPATTTGSYQVVVTATSGKVSTTTTLPLSLQ